MTYNAGILDKASGAERTRPGLYTKFAAYSAKTSTNEPIYRKVSARTKYTSSGHGQLVHQTIYQ